MTRFPSILVALVAVAVTVPVQAARPQFANRGGAVGAARHVVPQRRTVSSLPRQGQSVSRAPTASVQSHAGPTRRPADGIAGRTPGGRVAPLGSPGRLPIDLPPREVPPSRPGGPGPRPISIDRPDFDVSYTPGPDIKKPDLNGGGNNGGGRHPHPGRRPCHGPTGWDLVAIGLATAALVDGGVGQGGCATSDCVTVGQPTCCAGKTVVDSQPVEAEAAAGGLVPTADATLPQLRVGEPFQLPAKGLGTAQGRVAVKIGAAIFDCQVTAWNDAGLAATLPAMTLVSHVKAELIVAFADGTLAVAMPVELLPAAE